MCAQAGGLREDNSNANCKMYSLHNPNTKKHKNCKDLIATLAKLLERVTTGGGPEFVYLKVTLHNTPLRPLSIPRPRVTARSPQRGRLRIPKAHNAARNTNTRHRDIS